MPQRQGILLPILASGLGSGGGGSQTSSRLAESVRLRRIYQAAQSASASVGFNFARPDDAIRIIDLTADAAGDVGNMEELRVYAADVGSLLFPEGATASITGFAARSAFEWGGRDFVLTADAANETPYRAIFESFMRQGGAPLIEASMDGFAAFVVSGVASGTTLTITHNTKGEAGNGLQIRFNNAIQNNAQARGTLHQLPTGSYIEILTGRNRNVNWNTLVTQINRVNGSAGTQLVTASVTGNEAATNFRGNTIAGTTLTLTEGADAVDANTLVVRLSLPSTPTVTRILNTINGVTGKVMTASSSENGNSNISATQGGARASVTIPIATNANLVVQFAREGTAGNGITVVADNRLGGGYGASLANNVLTLTIDNARASPNQIAASLNAQTNDFNISASGSAAGTLIFPGGIRSFINDQTNTLSGGVNGRSGLIPVTFTTSLRGGEEAIPNVTALRIRGASMNNIVAALNGITDKRLTAALGSGADGPSYASFPLLEVGYPTYPEPITTVRLTGGESAANIEEQLEDLDFDRIELIADKLVYTAVVDWQTENTGNVSIKLQRLWDNLGEDGEDVWVDVTDSDHIFTVDGAASKTTERVFKTFEGLGGIYRFLTSGSAAALRATLNLTIDAQASHGLDRPELLTRTGE